MHATEEIWLLLLVVPAGHAQELLWVSDAWSAGFKIQRPTAADSGLDVGLSYGDPTHINSSPWANYI